MNQPRHNNNPGNNNPNNGGYQQKQHPKTKNFRGGGNN
jgi:hypothetical protein